MPSPHGGRLIDRLVPEARRERLREEAEELPRVSVSEEKRRDFENIAYGIYSPLEGPLTQEDYRSVLDRGRLSDGVPWTMPIVLDASEEEGSDFEEGDDVAISHGGKPFAIIHVEEKYPLNKKEYVYRVFKTIDAAHPGVARVMEMKPILVGGCIDLFEETPGRFPRYRLKPKETRLLFRERGWRTVAGFQTRNAPHLGHEYVQKTALAFVDGLFINPIIGRKKPGDFRDDVIIEAYETLLRHYYLRETAVLVTLEMEMRYAGPREAIFHAIVRKNFGCTHFIVGRDHAGIRKYYGPYEAQKAFDEYPDLGITPLFFRNFFYCRRCGGVTNERVCPHPVTERVEFSGTEIREMLMRGERPPKELMRPEVIEIILRHPNPFVR
jgi:sulfate adenylyltransferase